MRIHLQDTQLLIVDVQEKFVPHITEYDNLLKNIQILIKGIQALEINITLTEQYPIGLGHTVPEISNLLLNIKPIEKIEFSCYDSALCQEQLKNNSAKNILICGIEAHICVLQTAIDLKEAGYNPIIILDVVSSRYINNKNIALERYRQENIMISSTESILFELMRTFTHPQAKTVSKLVK